MKDGSICTKCNHRAYCAMGDEQNDDNVTIKGCYLYSEQKKQTNADRIRAMTDEELAEWMSANATNYACHKFSGMGIIEKYSDNGLIAKSWLDWLKQEAADEHQSM